MIIFHASKIKESVYIDKVEWRFEFIPIFIDLSWVLNEFHIGILEINKKGFVKYFYSEPLEYMYIEILYGMVVFGRKI